MEAGCVIFGMKHKKSKTIREKITVYKVGMTWRFGGNKKRKKIREKIMVYKVGMTWRFGGISNHNTSRGIYGRNILST